LEPPALDWAAITRGIKEYGIRNAAQNTIAPTGTIATVAGCEGYGCEPVFALAYTRHVNDNGRDLQLAYASPSFGRALEEAGLDEAARQAIIDQVMQEGSCQHIASLPAHLRDTFVVSQDITAAEHVRLQAALQTFVDNSLSKTVNFPANATVEDVAATYHLAWELGCKGITVYITGSRDNVVLETQATAKKKPAAAAVPDDDGHILTPEAENHALEQARFWTDAKKPRPRYLRGYTYSIETPLGKAFITINENGGSQPFEVFVNTAKAGSDTAAVSEAIGRLISYVLRLASPIEPRLRLKEVLRQLAGIGGGRSLGFGPTGCARCRMAWRTSSKITSPARAARAPMPPPNTIRTTKRPSRRSPPTSPCSRSATCAPSAARPPWSTRRAAASAMHAGLASAKICSFSLISNLFAFRLRIFYTI